MPILVESNYKQKIIHFHNYAMPQSNAECQAKNGLQTVSDYLIVAYLE